MQGVGSKQVAAWLDQYCPQRGKEPLETALTAYASELVGSAPAQPKAATKPAAGAKPAAEAPAGGGAAPAAAPRKPSAFAVGRNCDSWNTGRKSLDYYLLMSKSEEYLKAEVSALAAERGVIRDPMQGVGSKQITVYMGKYNEWSWKTSW